MPFSMTLDLWVVIWRIQPLFNLKLQKESFVISKVRSIKACFIQQLVITVIVIRMEILMIEKLLLALYFSWKAPPSPNIKKITNSQFLNLWYWIRSCHILHLPHRLGWPQGEPTKIYVDNKSIMALAKNLVFHDRSK